MNSIALCRYAGALACVLILDTPTLYAQPCTPPDARVSIVGTDGSFPGHTLWFGYALNATCGIDSAVCGEAVEPPPPPPTGVFYPRWFSYSCQKHPWFDYVAYRGPAAVDTHFVRWDTPPPTIFRWNPDSIRALCDSALFIDMFGGFLVRVRMDIDSGVVISQPVLTSAMIIRFGARPPLSVESWNRPSLQFQLEQNYPNPFNPSTTIYYYVSRPGLVKLLVLNVLGEQIVTLTDGYRDAGAYSVQWDASSVAGGVYFYQLVAVDFLVTKKCILLR